jgi:uncharacterized protein YbbC (DUF1343 family)/CubicO group peptidase (beta-lactamase class C family)
MNKGYFGACSRMACVVLTLALLSQAMAAPFKVDILAEIDREVAAAIGDKKCPGGVLWLQHQDEVYRKVYGNRAVTPTIESMTDDTIFDAASLTKVLACTPAVLLLVERGLIELDAPVKRYLTEFPDNGGNPVTIRHLLTHTSGLRPGISSRGDWRGQEGALQQVTVEKLQAEPGTTFRYSDINYITLGAVVQRVAGVPLEDFVVREIYQPLDMRDTGYLPAAEKLARVAPTEVVNGAPLRGVVHDPTARKMGGVAGHAGLFTTAADVARFARMMLNLGELDGKRVFKPETVRLMTSVQTPSALSTRRGLGWDIDSSYSGPRGKYFPLGSFGHTGWTGTSLWIDPFSRSFVIFLSNRNHPSEAGSVLALRSKIGTLAAQAISDFDFSNVSGALPPRSGRQEASAPPRPVLNGIDVLVREKFAPLRGLRIALITNHTGEDRQRRSTIDLLHTAPEVDLKFLYSPEHGIRGTLDEKISDTVDEKTGLQVISLYGKNRKPTPEQLRDVDAIVFDIQDIGCRFYTYPSTMGLAIEAASENKKKIIVLDRVNPINGTSVEGPILDAKPTFVGFYEVPLRHGMTVGELAKMYNAEKGFNADLQIIECENWRRADTFDRTGLPWRNQSPNMRNLKQAILYPGVGLLERAMSVGRGTDTPFEVVGAPYVDDVQLAVELNKAGLQGVTFVPIQFTPTFSVHKDKLCKGVYIMLNDPERCPVVQVGLEMAKTLYRLYPNDFVPDQIRHLLLHPTTLEMVKADKPMDTIVESWEPKLAEFRKLRTKYLLYR